MSILPKFYPIVPNDMLAEEYIKAGVRFLQIRIKDQSETEIRRQLENAQNIATEYGAKLVVNDYWQDAITLGCEYLHLGQEDIADADIDAINRAGIKLGISTHDPKELEYALSFNPYYVALGPVYFTQLKAMKWDPQGLDRVTEWKKLVGNTPLVGIGGITLERAEGVLNAGADCVSVVTDITLAEDRPARLKAWLNFEKDLMLKEPIL